MSKLATISVTYAVYFFAVVQAEYLVPYTATRFQPVLDLAKLQEFTSDGDTQILQDGIETYASHYFHRLLVSEVMEFVIKGSGKRSELRELTSSGSDAAWSISGTKTMTGTVAFPEQASGIEEVTFMQVHCGPDPLLRLVWMRLISNDDVECSDCIVASVRQGLGANDITKYFVIDRHVRDKNYEVKVSGSKLTITVAGFVVLNSLDVSFWNSYDCYFKAGAYNNNPTSNSAEAKTRFSQLAW